MSKTLGIVLVLLLCALFTWRLSSALQEFFKEDKQKNKEAAVAVEVTGVTIGEIRDVRTFTGTLNPRARFVFAPKIAGRLIKLPVQIGDEIKPGELIAAIDDEEYVQQVNKEAAALEVEKATVEQQQTELELAQKEMERIKSLHQKSIASGSDWDKAESAYKAQAAKLKVAKAQMTAQKSALKAAQVRLSYTMIHAPDDPTKGKWKVEERYVDAGAMLAANTPIISVVDISKMIAVINIIERDYPSISVGLKVEISTDAFPDKTFTGRVLRIAPVLSEASRQARIEIEINNPELLLRPGMYIRASMEFARHAEAQLVPRAALVKRNKKAGIFVIQPGADQVDFAPVKVGIRDAEYVEILNPKIKGKVVTLGQHMLADKTKIIISNPKDERKAGK